MTGPIAGISDEAVENATGDGWSFWLDLLDDCDGTSLDHKARVAALADAGVDSGWWQQQLAVGYERERGLRDVGETKDAGYQVGVQRTMSVEQEALWKALTSTTGRAVWLGEMESFDLVPGATYQTAEGTTGEIRTVDPGNRIRLTWQPGGRQAPTTLQLTLEGSTGDQPKTILRVHHEKLADADERSAMRDHWRAVLDHVEQVLED